MAFHRNSHKHGAGGLHHHRSPKHHRALSAEQKAAESKSRKGKPHPHKGVKRPRPTTGPGG